MEPAGTWQRWLLAGFALVFLILGGVLAVTDLLESGSREYVSGTMLKVGFVLGMAWLAAPQLERFGWHNVRGTLLIALIIVAVLWAIKPRIGAVAGAIVVISSLLFAAAGWIRRFGDLNRK